MRSVIYWSQKYTEKIVGECWALLEPTQNQERLIFMIVGT